MDRRAILKLGAFAIAASAIPTRITNTASNVESGVTYRPTATTNVAFEQSATGLQKVQVVPDRVIRIVTGLRPFRPSGFLVRANHIGGKTIIHNYGHGGCGVTLSWGTGQLAVDLALKTQFRQAAVLGCGAVGLATARLLQDHGFQVTLYAKDLPPHTTSNIAGAMWEPVTLSDHDRRTPEFVTQFAQASRIANRYFQTLVGERYGIKWVPIFYVGNEPMGASWPSTITPELYPTTTLTEGSHPFPSQFVSRRYTMLIEPSTYLPAVIADFCVRGGKIVVRDFRSIGSLLRLREPLIVNCTGLGAKALFHDDELTPIKGQLTVLVPQPGIDYGMVSTSSELYMFPRRDGIVLGGSHERDEWSLEPNEAAADRIFKGHQQFFSQMR
ncbi:MAG: FAD-dependent oxidoreductase [Blastocatellia bacterium]